MPPAAASEDDHLTTRLGVRPLPGDLLYEALTHSSFINETDASAVSNERLEFLGDAVLGFVVAAELFQAYPDAGEGALTRMRAELVRGTTLARIAERLELGAHIVLGRGEEAAGGRSRNKNLAGALEAMIGAVYQAHGMRPARSLIRRLFREELAQVKREGASLDAKSRLQQVVQALWRQPPEYVTVEAAPDSHGRMFVATVRAAGTELGQGAGSTKRAAQQEAAIAALARLADGPEGHA